MSEKGSVTLRVARWSAGHPWRAILMWVVFVVVCLGVGQVSGLHQASSVQTTVGQAGVAARTLHDAGMTDPATEGVLITARHGALDAGQARQAASEVSHRLHGLTGVSRVSAPKTSANGHAVYVQATMTGDPETADSRVQPLLDATAAVQHAHPGLRVEEVGSASLNKAVNDQVSKDLGKAADVSLPVTLIILLVAFGAIIAAGVPVLLAMSAVGAATGLSSLVSHLIPDSGSTSSMILLMGMAVGVDYSLFYVKRVREERQRGTHDPIEAAARTAGHSVLVSGAAVIVSMFGLFLAQNVVFSSLAAGSIMVVAVAVVGSLTVLPALLAKLGRHVDRPRVPLLWRLTAREREPRLWPTALRPALNHPGRTLLVSVVALLALATPALGLTLHGDSPESLPRSIAEVQTYQRLAANFPGEQSTHQVVVKTPAGDRAAAAKVTAELHAVEQRVSGDPAFALPKGGVQVKVSADGTVREIELPTPHDAESAASKRGLAELRDTVLPATVGTVHQASWSVGGDTAANVDLDRHSSARLPWSIAFVVLATMVIMVWVFRSAAIALVTAVVNLLSVVAAFGVLALTFQHGWAEHLLDFHNTGAVINWIPLFTFAVLFGLSMDYHVLMLSRIREAAERGLSPKDAVREGVTRSAGTVTSAAVVMVSVFAIFATLHMVEMKELGLTLAVAVLIDALVVRVVLLPSILVLLGRRAWWPSRPGLRPPRRAAQHAAPRVPVG